MPSVLVRRLSTAAGLIVTAVEPIICKREESKIRPPFEPENAPHIVSHLARSYRHGHRSLLSNFRESADNTDGR